MNEHVGKRGQLFLIFEQLRQILGRINFSHFSARKLFLFQLAMLDGSADVMWRGVACQVVQEQKLRLPTWSCV